MAAVTIRTGKTRQIRQGDIFRDIEMIESVSVRAGHVVATTVEFPLVIVLTQDCDLEQDYGVRYSRRRTTTHDKRLLSVLVSPLYNAEHVFAGDQLRDLGQRMQTISKNGSDGKRLVTNQTLRYHYLDFPASAPIPASVVDFKHYFSVNVEYLKKLKRAKFVLRLSEVNRDDVSQRFASYLSRVALP